MQYINVAGTPQPKGHYSQAVVHGGLAYVSGILPADMVTGERFGHQSIAEQTARALENLDTVLKAAGTSPGNVVKLTIFIASATYWADVNAECARFFGDHRPARSIIPVPELYDGCALELEAVAAVAS